MAKLSPIEQKLQAAQTENERLRRSVGELSLLNELALAIGATNDPEKIIHTIVRKALQCLHAEQGDIMLVNTQEEDHLSTLVRTGADSKTQSKFRINSSLLGWIQLNKKPLLINEPENDERFRGSVWDPGIKNVLSVPLLIRSRLIGMLSVYNKKTSPAIFTEDDQRLLSIIASQSAHIIENARLTVEEKALVAMREEFRLAQEIQQSLLPKKGYGSEHYDIVGSIRQANTVGGDYYDIFVLDEHHLGLCVGDASGKGLPASLFIANVQATMQGQALWSPSVSVCLTRVNQLVSQRTRKGIFATLYYGVLNTTNHQFSYANAGHNRPILCKGDGKTVRLSLGDLALGFKSNFTYREESIDFEKGDTLLIYSDGLPEARNEDGELFGEERIPKLLAESIGKSAQAVIDTIYLQVDAFTGKAPIADDMTLLVIQRRR